MDSKMVLLLIQLCPPAQTAQQSANEINAGGPPVNVSGNEFPKMNTTLVMGQTVNGGFGQSASQMSNHKKSLNRDLRRRELIKITLENQAFLRRLQNKTSNYNVNRWEEEENERKRILKNICEYDYIIDQPPLVSHTITPGGERNANNNSSFLPKLTGNSNSKPTEYNQVQLKKRGGGLPQGNATSMGPFYKKRGYASSQLEVRRESNPKSATNPVNNQIAMLKSSLGYECSQRLYQGQRDLGANSGAFYVEIFLNKKGDLVITAQHTVRMEISFVIEITSDKVNQLMPEFAQAGPAQQYSYMADNLKIMNSRMVLLNPKFVKPPQAQLPPVVQKQNSIDRSSAAKLPENPLLQGSEIKQHPQKPDVYNQVISEEGTSPQTTMKPNGESKRDSHITEAVIAEKSQHLESPVKEENQEAKASIVESIASQQQVADRYSTI